MKFLYEPEVSLIDYTHDPIKRIIYAIRKCKDSQEKSDSIYEDALQCQTIIGEKDKKLLESCISYKHNSVLEHVDFSFLLTISRVTQLQLVRHRISTFAAQSFRVLKPELFHIPSKLNEEIYKEAYDLSMQFYDKLISLGSSIEDARKVVPCGIMSQIIYKTNLSSLRNAIAERTCLCAQEEIRIVFKKICKIIKSINPILLFKVEKCYTCPNQSKCSKAKDYI